MYIATVPNRNSPPAILLRESYREGGTVKTRTLANLTSWPAVRVAALKRCLRGDFDGSEDPSAPVSDRIFGVLFALKELASRLGMVSALGQTRVAKLALFLVLARVAHQGSRLSAVRWAADHAVAEVLGLAPFDEDALYTALDWLATQQETIEKKLYRAYVRRAGQPPILVLYDVTSSYFEGDKNELAAYGHNRDGKQGKKQLVIGLLTAPDGEPLTVTVFKGNTADPSTVAEHIERIKTRFKITEVVFVGDRGMVKATGKTALTDQGLRYITALTDPQIRKLLKRDLLQLDLFDETAQEVEHGTRRLILRRNEARQHKEAHRRQDKLAKLHRLVAERNAFVQQANRATPEAGLRQLTQWAKTHTLTAFLTLTLQDTQLTVELDEAKQADAALLDGCYVLETDVPPEAMDAATVDARYRDLQHVERDFRTMKTSLLEMRPIFVRKATHTCGHVFAAMLALKVAREGERGLKAALGTTEHSAQALTLKDALSALSRLCFQRHEVAGQEFLQVPRPDQRQTAILTALGVKPPAITKRHPTKV
ncbi:MAG: IS1634 family transposase [Nitrospinae bacterium]|nr:IS1634 family transposase [Nitrospinota bacterium]